MRSTDGGYDDVQDNPVQSGAVMCWELLAHFGMIDLRP